MWMLGIDPGETLSYCAPLRGDTFRCWGDRGTELCEHCMTMEPRASLKHKGIDKEGKELLCSQNSSISPVDPRSL